MADSKKYDGSQWEHSLRKLTTATADIEPTIYTDGTAITSYTLKGNTVQNGTPTPSNPVDVSGVGVRTANLCNPTPYKAGYYISAEGQEVQNNVFDIYSISATANQSYTISANVTLGGNTVRIHAYTNGTWTEQVKAESSGDLPWSFTAPTGCDEIRISITHNAYEHIMVNTGTTALPFEPYGFKIPILTAQGSAVNYLGSVQSTRQIKKLVLDGNEESWTRSTSYSGGFFASWSYFGGMKFNAIYCSHAQYVSDITDYVSGTCYSDGSLNIRVMPEGSTVTQWREYLAQQYANGTPVTVWYVLATAETGIVNEPLMKIGTYADTLTNAVSIPTTEGANSITVDTTVQPSEFTATWTGWHDSFVQEYMPLLTSNPLCGVDTYKDTLNLATGACTRQINKLVLDGTETGWTKSSTYQGSFYARILTNCQMPEDGDDKIYAYCTHAEYINRINYTNYVYGKCGIDGDQSWAALHINLFIGEAAWSVDDFKAYLAQQYANGTPVTVWYVLKTPTTETITVPSGLSGTEEGYLTQSETPTPTNPVYPTANEVVIWQ